jgi:outer membrane receptor protein involved in Fe transport
VVGLRADLFRFDVTSHEPSNSGTETAGILSPKASLVSGPWASTEFYLNAGRGFHSNDARGTTIRLDPVTKQPTNRVTPLVGAMGAEVGIRTVAIPRTQLTFGLWTLALDSELLFVGDAGTTGVGRSSRRNGLELSAYTALIPHLHVDADLALSRARFTADEAAGVHVPGAAGVVGSAALSLVDWRRIGAGVRWRYLGAQPLTEDGLVHSEPTSTVNAQVSYALTRQVRLRLDVFNALNSRASDIDYLYVSRLAGEPAEGIADIHTHPLPPRTVRAAVTVGF